MGAVTDAPGRKRVGLLRVNVYGSGLTGAVAARVLSDAGCDVRVFEGQSVWGGQLRPGDANGVLYEPQGAHIFHTHDQEVWNFVTGFVEFRPYRHEVKTEIGGRLLSWPPQLQELRALPEWRKIERELDLRPAQCRSDNFEVWCEDLMGRTLYDWFVRDYTIKQWGREPTELSAAWAPKRIEIRDDGYLGLFRDPFQGWPRGGYLRLIDGLLAPIPAEMGRAVSASTWEEFRSADAAVLTVPLDVFFEEVLGPLEWRGVRLVNEYFPEDHHVLPCAVVNHPGLDEAYTRRIETKWMSGQGQKGTVVSREYSGHRARHYPVDDVAGENRRLANSYRDLVAQEFGPMTFVAGRLATYSYIDMDQAVRQGLNVARQVLASR